MTSISKDINIFLKCLFILFTSFAFKRNLFYEKSITENPKINLKNPDLIYKNTRKTPEIRGAF